MFNRNAYRSPAQRASKAMLNIIARLGGCGFLIYFVVKILTIPEADRPDPTTTTIIGIVFILVSVFLIGITVMDGINGIRTGRFKASTYEALDMSDFLEKQEADGADESAQQELETHAADQPEPDENEGNETEPDAGEKKED